MWICQLGETLDLSDQALLGHIDALGLDKYVISRSTKYPTLDVPPQPELRDLLLSHGVDSDLLEPMQALLQGTWHRLKWLQHPFVDDDGSVVFDATWTGKLPPSRVTSDSLNASALDYVCVCFISASSHFASRCTGQTAIWVGDQHRCITASCASYCIWY